MMNIKLDFSGEVQWAGDSFSGYVCERGEIGDGTKIATHRPWLKGVVWQVTSDSDEAVKTNEQALVKLYSFAENGRKLASPVATEMQNTFMAVSISPRAFLPKILCSVKLTDLRMY
jgi:hypothetical protein